MSPSISAIADEPLRGRKPPVLHAEAPRTLAGAASWGAIIAGAAAAAALSLILLILGVGLGLSSVSPWAREGIDATSFGWSTIAWLTLTQLAASAMGGYLAGRLRTKWVEVHRDEVYFRDTAHGFLAWAVASLATAALLGSAIGAIVGGGAKLGLTAAGAGATVATGAAAAIGAAGAAPSGYFVDSLFRKDAAGTDAGAATAAAPPSAEVARIFANAGGSAALPEADARYVAQLVAQRTGLSPQDAQARVSEVYTRLQTSVREAQAKAQLAADAARRASAYAALWLFVSLLAGAFVSSLAATWGGRRRDA